MKVQNDKVLFTAESKYQKYSSIFTQISSVAVAIYCCLHIKENPPVIIIFSLFLLLVFVLCGHGIVRVYKDSIEFEFRNSLVPFFTKKWHFGFHEIVSIDTNLRFGRKEQFLADLTNSSIISLSTWNTIKFRLANGKEKTISTKIYKADVLKAFEMVKHLSLNKIQFT